MAKIAKISPVQQDAGAFAFPKSSAEDLANLPSLSDEYKAVTRPAFQVSALLAGALALLEEHQHLNDDLWAVRELVELAWMQANAIHGDRGSALLSRLEEVRHD